MYLTQNNYACQKTMILPSRRAKCRLKLAEQLLLPIQNLRGFTDVCYDNFQLNEFDLTYRGLTSTLKSLQLINVHHQQTHGVPRESNKTYLLKQSTQFFVYFLRFSVSGLFHVLQRIKQTVPIAAIHAYSDRYAQTQLRNIENNREQLTSGSRLKTSTSKTEVNSVTILGLSIYNTLKCVVLSNLRTLSEQKVRKQHQINIFSFGKLKC